MNIQYDPKVDAMYITLGNGTYNKSRKISSSIMVDEDEKGKILGIEILAAKQNIPAFNEQDIAKIKVESGVSTPIVAIR